MSAKLPTLLYGLMANIYTQGHIFSTAMPFGIDGWLKDSACANIPSIFVTLDTFHLLSGWLKDLEHAGGDRARLRQHAPGRVGAAGGARVVRRRRHARRPGDDRASRAGGAIGARGGPATDVSAAAVGGARHPRRAAVLRQPPDANDPVASSLIVDSARVGIPF